MIVWPGHRFPSNRRRRSSSTIAKVSERGWCPRKAKAMEGDKRERDREHGLGISLPCPAIPWPWSEPSSLRFAAIRRRLDELEGALDRRIAEWVRSALDRLGR